MSGAAQHAKHEGKKQDDCRERSPFKGQDEPHKTPLTKNHYLGINQPPIVAAPICDGQGPITCGKDESSPVALPKGAKLWVRSPIHPETSSRLEHL